jgi:hypothetical protein
VSDAKDELQFVAEPPSGWCDPVTGTCYTGDEAAPAETSNENVTGALPGATER